VPNSFSRYVLPAGAGLLPDLDDALTGRPLEGLHWSSVAGLVHHAWARAQRQRLSQSWQGDALELIGPHAGVVDMTQPWRCPTVSPQHTTIQAWVRCARTGGVGPVLRLDSLGGAGAWVPVPAVLGWIQLTATLAAGVEYDTITLQAQGVVGAGQTLVVESLSLEVAPLPSPLFAGPVVAESGEIFLGLGQVTLGGDYPLSSARLQALRQSLRAIYRLPRLLHGWTGVSTTVATQPGKGTSPRRLQPQRPYQVHPRVQIGDTEYSTATIWALVQPDAAVDTSVTVSWGSSAESITVPWGGPLAWYSSTLPAPARESRGDIPPHATLSITAGPLEGLGGLSTAEIRSLSVWGT
jgi:hypothetical protein